MGYCWTERAMDRLKGPSREVEPRGDERHVSCLSSSSSNLASFVCGIHFISVCWSLHLLRCFGMVVFICGHVLSQLCTLSGIRSEAHQWYGQTAESNRSLLQYITPTQSNLQYVTQWHLACVQFSRLAFYSYMTTVYFCVVISQYYHLSKYYSFHLFNPVMNLSKVWWRVGGTCPHQCLLGQAPVTHNPA